MEFFLQLFFQGLSIGFLYALAALGFVMIFKSSSVLNFAHGELLAIGAYLFLVMATRLPIWLTFSLTLIGTSASSDRGGPHRSDYVDGRTVRHV